MEENGINDPAQLRRNLQEYEQQIEEVEQLLLDDPENAEYKDIYDGLQEVTKLTKELLEAAQAEETPRKESPNHQHGPVAAITKAPEVKVPSILPPQVKEQIRIAQQRAALAGQAPPEWAIGASVQGRYSGDGKWYAGEITAISAAGKFIVHLNQYDIKEEMELEDLRQNGVADEYGKNISGYQGVQAPKRNVVKEDSTTLEEPPAWMIIKPSDNERTKLKKKKLLKSFKSKQRFLKMDLEQKKKADSWKSFISAKGTKKKAGFMTGRKKKSIFSVGEGSKVGIVSKPQGHERPYSAKRKHEFK